MYLINPATNQTIKDIPGDPVCFKTTTGDTNIPEPITNPKMCAAPSSIPNLLGNIFVSYGLLQFLFVSDLVGFVWIGLCNYIKETERFVTIYNLNIHSLSLPFSALIMLLIYTPRNIKF